MIVYYKPLKSSVLTVNEETDKGGGGLLFGGTSSDWFSTVIASNQ